MTAKSFTTLRQKLALAAMSLIFLALILEVGLRMRDAYRGLGFFSQHKNKVAQEIEPLLPFRTFGKPLYKTEEGRRFISSSHGELFPIKKPEGTVRIVCFGGSTTENKYVYKEHGIHYPIVLQSKLRDHFPTDRIEVINVGMTAYSTAHSLILLSLDVLSWDPDLVILSHNINDLTAAYFPGFTFDYSNKFSNKFYSMPDFKSIYTTSNILFQHSRLYWAIKDRIRRLQKANYELPPLRRKTYAEGLDPVVPRVFERNLRSFAALAQANGIRTVLGNQALQPSQENFLIEREFSPYNDIINYPEHHEFVEHHRLFNERIKKAAHETGSLFVDNDSKLAGRKELFIDGFHYTPEGIEMLAQNYAAAIVKSGLIGLEEIPSNKK